MTLIKSYGGRKFLESKSYFLVDRYVVGRSINNVWLYTVDKCKELDRETNIPTEKIIMRIVKWRAINDEKNKHKKYWRIRSQYNIRSSGEWSSVSAIMDLIVDVRMQDPNFIFLPVKEYEKLTKNIQKFSALRKEIKKLKTEESVKNVQLEVFKKRISMMKDHIKKYDNVLKKFIKIINDDNSNETEIHKFLVENDAFWLFGLEYLKFESKVKFPPGKNDFELDLALKRYDGFWDLVELKGPNENLFDKRTNKRNKPNVKLTEALGQVITYLRACEIANLSNVLKPKAIIVIGKEKTDKIYDRRLLSSYLPNIELLTYHDLYERGKKLLSIVRESAYR